MTRRARDVLLDILRDEGVTHVFGNPGSTEMPLMDALVDAPDITYVLGLQEATAVGMADGWALASGRAGFVNLHAMGGLGNAMGVLVASKASETPLVVTAGQQDTRHLMTEPWLSGDLVALAAPVTKWAKEVRRGEDVGQALRRAFAVSRTAPCGPVFLSLPMDVLDQEVSGATPPASAPPRLGASPDAARLAERLAALDPDRVVVLLGDDLPAAVSAGLIAFAEAGGFPVWGTQLTSRAAFPSAHPAWAGVMKPDFAVMRQHFESAEAIVLVGGRAFVAYPYRDAEPVPSGVAVHARRRQSGGLRPGARRRHGAHRRHRPDARSRRQAARRASSTGARSRRGSRSVGLGSAPRRRRCGQKFSPRPARRCRPTQPFWRRSTRCRRTR